MIKVKGRLVSGVVGRREGEVSRLVHCEIDRTDLRTAGPIPLRNHLYRAADLARNSVQGFASAS